jgi:hypothetical protein
VHPFCVLRRRVPDSSTASSVLTVSFLGLYCQVLSCTFTEALVLTTRGRQEGEVLHTALTYTRDSNPRLDSPERQIR